ncbi:hypothetical protein BU198_34410 [Streptomyces sp. CBMA156]|nr:hypothetical protein [Streptomyces sp. CBMA156]
MRLVQDAAQQLGGHGRRRVAVVLLLFQGEVSSLLDLPVGRLVPVGEAEERAPQGRLGALAPHADGDAGLVDGEDVGVVGDGPGVRGTQRRPGQLDLAQQAVAAGAGDLLVGQAVADDGIAGDGLPQGHQPPALGVDSSPFGSASRWASRQRRAAASNSAVAVSWLR